VEDSESTPGADCLLNILLEVDQIYKLQLKPNAWPNVTLDLRPKQTNLPKVSWHMQN